MINWGDYQNMPDYREGWQDPHQSGVARLGRTFDATNYIPGLNKLSSPIHDAAEGFADLSNRALSPVMKGLDKFTETTTPGLKQLRSAVPGMEGITNFVNNKPIDAAAIAAATFFTGGAAGNALGPASGGAGGAAGAGAAGGALGAGASSPLIAGAAGTTSALTQALPAAAGSGLGVGASSPLIAGAAGTTSALAPALAGMTQGNPGLIGSIQSALEPAKPYFQGAMRAKDQYSALSDYGMPDQTQVMNQRMQNDLAERIRTDDPNEIRAKPQDAIAKKKRIIDAMMQQQKFFGSVF